MSDIIYKDIQYAAYNPEQTNLSLQFQAYQELGLEAREREAFHCLGAKNGCAPLKRN